jgi:hypothetical protein
MAGNVSEWVLDVYRPLSFEDVSDFAPYRGNVFTTRVTDAEGYLVPKDSLGRIKYRQVSEEEALGRFNYRKANNINYLDGDYQSLINVDWAQQSEDENNTEKMYSTVYPLSSATNQGFTKAVHGKIRPST